MMVVLAVAIPTLIGSICSLIAASFIFICYFIFPFKAHFRHILILNLATADFINALNNTISGIYYIARGSFSTGPACTANGFIGQLSVQGTDFSILLIAIVTVIVLKSPRFLPNTSPRSQILLSLVVWIVPVITSTTGLALNAYGPVSGNWCWLTNDRADLRYALTHGWRMGIIITTIGLYAYLFFYFRQVLSVEQHPSTQSIKDKGTEHIMTAMANPYEFAGNAHLPRPLSPVYEIQGSGSSDSNDRFSIEKGPFELPTPTVPQAEHAGPSRQQVKDIPWQAEPSAFGELTGEPFVNELEGDYPATDSEDDGPPSYQAVQDMESRDLLAAAWVTNFSSSYSKPQRNRKHFSTPLDSNSKDDLNVEIGDIASRQPTYATDFGTMNRARNKQIQRALLLNAYPIAYVLLWLPGLINRFVELSTGKSSFTLQVLQSSTQFVGVANAVTYGFNERVRRRVRNYFRRRGSCLE